MKVKARILEAAEDEFEVGIYVGRVWRVFGTPYKKGKNLIQGFSHKKAAKRSAEKVAGALGIELIWEDTK
jgi:hypothetical protein